MPALENGQELWLPPQDNIVVVGAGGFTANALYLRNFTDMGIDPSQIALVDTDEEKLGDVQRKLGLQSDAYLDLDSALVDFSRRGKNVGAVVIASSTAAHVDNIYSITSAADAGMLDLSKTPIWCEKPVTPPETFEEIHSLAALHPDLNISVGYILRYSHTLTALQNYLTQHGITITGLDWVYGKDRTQDMRPTQGVFPDEVVHPLSVTDLVLSRSLGTLTGVEVAAADIQRRPFADPVVQKQAWMTNPDIPADPTSDVDATLRYSLNNNGLVSEVPVTISSSFLFEKEIRKLNVLVSGPAGPDVLTLDFDVRRLGPNNTLVRADVLKKQDGTIIHEWSGDKSRAQIENFMRCVLGKEGSAVDAATSLETEGRIQGILKGIGAAALNGAA